MPPPCPPPREAYRPAPERPSAIPESRGQAPLREPARSSLPAPQFSNPAPVRCRCREETAPRHHRRRLPERHLSRLTEHSIAGLPPAPPVPAASVTAYPPSLRTAPAI